MKSTRELEAIAQSLEGAVGIWYNAYAVQSGIQTYPPCYKIRIVLMASLKSPNKHAFGVDSLHLVCQRSRNLEVRPTTLALSC